MGAAIAGGKTLDQIPVTAIKGVGASLSAKLAKIGLFSVQDILLHLPLRYMDRTRITPIGALQPNVNAVLEAEVRACDVVFGKRRSLVCKVQDGARGCAGIAGPAAGFGPAIGRFFHQQGRGLRQQPLFYEPSGGKVPGLS